MTLQIKTETTVGLFIVAAIGVFFYMGFKIGSFRFDKGRYATYYLLFKDISGLSKKAEVKIAGVKVGWVEHLDLTTDGRQVRAQIMISKDHILHTDAYGIVRQDGLLGGKYLEIVPGDPLLPRLAPDSVLSKPSKEPVAVDELLSQFKVIAHNVEEITHSLKDAIGGQENAQQLRDTVASFNTAAQRIASFSQSLDRLVQGNESNFNSIITDLRQIASDLRTQIPSVGNDIHNLADRLSTSLDRDFNRIATRIESTTRPLQEVAQKINDGKGILGQLVNDDESYRDLKVAVKGLKDYFAKVDKIGVVFDIHTESMTGPAEHAHFKETKSYVNVRLHPNEDYFYLAGLVATRKGAITRFDQYNKWYDEKCDPILPSQLVADKTSPFFPSFATQKIIKRNSFFFNLQFGKVYNDLAFRFGLFDSTGGIAVDYDIPFKNENFRWVTSLEAFDFIGQNRLDDDRPHFKWINKMFLLRNIYFVLGADDFISKHNKNAFFGVGIRFSDDDIKYLLPHTDVLL